MTSPFEDLILLERWLIDEIEFHSRRSNYVGLHQARALRQMLQKLSPIVRKARKIHLMLGFLEDSDIAEIALAAQKSLTHKEDA